MPLLLSSPPTPSGYHHSSPARPSPYASTAQSSSSWGKRANRPSAIPTWALPVPKSASTRSLPLKSVYHYTSNPPRSPFLPDRYEEDDAQSGTDTGSTFSDVESSPISPPRSVGTSSDVEDVPDSGTVSWPLIIDTPTAAAVTSADADLDLDLDLSDDELASLSTAVIEEVVRVIRYHPVLVRNVKPRLVTYTPRPNVHTHRAAPSSMIHKSTPPLPAIPARSRARRPSSCSVVDLPYPHHPSPHASHTQPPHNSLRSSFTLTRGSSRSSRHSVHLDRPSAHSSPPHASCQTSGGHAATAVMRPEFKTFISRGAASASLARPNLVGMARGRHEASLDLDRHSPMEDGIHVTSNITVSTSGSLSSTYSGHSAASHAHSRSEVETFHASRRPWLPQRRGHARSNTTGVAPSCAKDDPWLYPDVRGSQGHGERTRKLTLTPALLRDDNESVRSLALPAKLRQAALSTGDTLTNPMPSPTKIEAHLANDRKRSWRHQRTNTGDSSASNSSVGSNGPTSAPREGSLKHQKTMSSSLKGLKSSLVRGPPSPLSPMSFKLFDSSSTDDLSRPSSSSSRKSLSRSESRRSFRSHTAAAKRAGVVVRMHQELAPVEGLGRELMDLHGRIGC